MTTDTDNTPAGLTADIWQGHGPERHRVLTTVPRSISGQPDIIITGHIVQLGDATLDPTDPPYVYIEGADVALPPQQARELAAEILAAADEIQAATDHINRHNGTNPLGT